ncbi:hypothetical protein AF331_10445 [Rossellomorea marisflavi]|uniref:DUF4003 domain-containing protein n=1 Tax=Rossellomorea marisflavi TaxID=189381 RepID=A0A0M0G619_9BACI|nr:DUF4003 family protein [Rossellomorea marisflavi]KON85335.1 hypothetical protein AF331_10445 [Rossellomorea marisflavi]
MNQSFKDVITMMQNQINQYEDIYTTLKKRLRWQVSDHQVLMLTASIYCTNDHPFDVERFMGISEMIKKESGMFSHMKSQLRFSCAALLDVKTEGPHLQFERLQSLYNRLIEAGFKKGVYTHLAALAVLGEEEIDPDLPERALTLYKRMAKEHLFLTGHSDYPFAMLLAKKGQENIVDYIETFYDQLNHEGFRKGNDLQTMSHILSLQEEEGPEVMISRALRIHDALRSEGIRMKPAYYPQVALLSFVKDADCGRIRSIWDNLNSIKAFKWHKDVNFMMAVNFYVSHHLEDASLAQTSLSTTIETLIQAQQTAMIATLSASAVITSSSNDS